MSSPYISRIGEIFGAKEAHVFASKIPTILDTDENTEFKCSLMCSNHIDMQYNLAQYIQYENLSWGHKCGSGSLEHPHESNMKLKGGQKHKMEDSEGNKELNVFQHHQ